MYLITFFLHSPTFFYISHQFYTNQNLRIYNIKKGGISMIYEVSEQDVLLLKSILARLFLEYGNTDEVLLLSSVVDEIVLQEQAFVLKYNS